MSRWLTASRVTAVMATLLLFCLSSGNSWAGLHCDINSGGAAPFSPFTRENPIAVDENTPDYTVVLSLD